MKTLKIFGLALFAAAAFTMTSCNDNELDPCNSVITTSNTELNDLDRWLLANYNRPYNIDFKYRYEDIEGDFNYYLVPCAYDDAVIMAHLVKYLCIETYNEVAGTDFTCQYFPKMFYTVGEWKYRNNGTFILGTAEGGRKIFLAGLNYLQSALGNAQLLNEHYFKTIHHEFTHILNQTKPIPSDFQLITGTGYVGDMWNESPYQEEHFQNGFISYYSQNSYTEDFAEMLSIYITNTEAQWNTWMNASTTNSAPILQKLDVVRNYMKDSFGIDIDKLRDVLQRRQTAVVNGEVDLTDLTID